MGGSKKIIILAIIVGFLLVLAVLYFLLANPINKKIENNQNQNQSATTTQVYEESIKRGKVGEVKENNQNFEASNQNVGSQQQASQKVYDLPDVVTATAGVISEIGDNYIIVKGDGTNFIDGQPRDLKCVFTDSAYAQISSGESYDGKVGLAHLKIGMKVAVGGDENIRGKAEFLVKSVNVIQ